MTPATPDRDAIAARAFALYVRRGRQPGRAMDDWLEAERQIRAEATALRPEAGAPRGSLAGDPVPAKPLPAAPAATWVPAPAATVSLAPTPVPSAPAASRGQGGRKGRKRR